jgi:hypothetical protein
MSGKAILGIDITDIDTSSQAAFALLTTGATDSQSGGTREYIYVQYAASTDFSVGDVVAISAAGVATPITTANAAPGQSVGRKVGVVVRAVSSLATPQYGWVQVSGIGAIRVLASAVLNTPLNTTATAGVLDDDATAGSRVIDGVVLNATNGGSTALVAAMLNNPFVGRTL